ncbi:MAG TPA: FHA domain-containing protein [Candidatus Baltobacteraceae bacterium]|nr:FHA domain-containing protein [Candidatus Baltobacteraceae bacterium]
MLVLAVALEAQLRVGSLEILGALAVVAVFATRPPVRPASEAGRLVPMRVGLEIHERGQTRRFEGRPPFEVGRSAEAHVSLRDPEVSRQHACFQSRNGVVYVDDLQSRNGTFLNGKRVTEAIEVREGDAVDVGTTRMMVRTVEKWT